ncbi:DUF3857 domain-containing protein [Frigoriflavimonas asaccharolytica]|uniref:DUF3857 domain-containing protein n=1 Tax=Frigoriflavimonas asaccharolytica TaxID=2735899 RepID=A0A8J8GDP5_9FLAO|nr:DUF3857 domain-containing protein [Frigoriflavimonas asaccharolytica]NRS93922.1 hypothetical protein [Frigoriflavimonas asaccharolytica]
MKKAIFSVLFMLIAHLVAAQKPEFLKVPALTIEDLQSKKSNEKAEASAEILYASYYYRVDYNGMMYVEIINRVKIYNKDKASDYLDHQISLYDGYNGREKLMKLEAFTYNLVDGKIKATKVEKDSKFKSKEDKDYSITKFAFPEVKDGSIVEYKYSVETPFFYSIPKVMIQREIPIKYLEYVLEAPTEISYTINYTGTLIPDYNFYEKKEIFGGTHNSYTYAYKNVAAYKDENFVGNNYNYKSSIKPEVNSTFFRSGLTKYTQTWEDVRKTLYQNENFGSELRKTNVVKNFLPATIKSNTNLEEKANAILHFVQSNYKWNNEVGVVSNDGVKNLISTKIGNSAEINFLLILLLKDAGLEANPVVLSTVGKGSLNTAFPSLYQLNYVIAHVQLGEESLLYDATSKYSSKNSLPPRALNYIGYLMTEKNSKQIDITYKDKSETILSIEANLNKDGTFSGQFSDFDSNLFAMMGKEMYEMNKEEYQKVYKDKYAFPLKNIKSESKGNNGFETTFNFESDSFVDAIGNKLVFNPLLFLHAKNHDFNQEEERKSAIEFLSAYTKTKKVTIQLPEGYQFENIPSSKKFRTDDNAISYLYFVNKEGNKLIIETSTTISSAIYQKEYYEAFKQIFDNITKLEGQVVTAVKSQK